MKRRESKGMQAGCIRWPYPVVRLHQWERDGVERGERDAA